MEVSEQYLPTIEERKTFLKTRISEYKKQMFGGTIEVLMATANGEVRNVKVTEDQMEQLQKNIDILVAELKKIES